MKTNYCPTNLHKFQRLEQKRSVALTSPLTWIYQIFLLLELTLFPVWRKIQKNKENHLKISTRQDPGNHSHIMASNFNSNNRSTCKTTISFLMFLQFTKINCIPHSLFSLFFRVSCMVYYQWVPSSMPFDFKVLMDWLADGATKILPQLYVVNL